MSNKKLWLTLALFGSVGLMMGGNVSKAQDATGIVDSLIKQFQGDNAPTPPPPQTIPDIAPQGDNAQLPAIPSISPTYEERPSVILRALDKVTARTQTFQIPVGQQFNFGALTIAVRACRARPELEPRDAAAFLQVIEQKPGEAITPRFSGWMFASSPSLSAMEHPVYDLRVLGCGSATLAEPLDSPAHPKQ